MPSAYCLQTMILLFLTQMNKNIPLFRSSTRQYIRTDICADEGTPTSDASCARHVGVSEKWHKCPAVSPSHPNRDPVALILQQREEALPKLYNYCGPPSMRSERSAVRGPHCTHSLCGQDRLVLGVLHQVPKEMAVFSITCPTDFPARLLSDLKFSSEQRCIHQPQLPQTRPHCLTLANGCWTLWKASVPPGTFPCPSKRVPTE